jgi:drug/metabolite transporter (DMT)-like permease
MKARAYALMLMVVAIWGATFVVVKGALSDATPTAFNLVRMTLAFLVLAVAYHRYWGMLRRRHLLGGALVGLCLAAGYQFQTIGLVRTTPSKSAFITGLLVVIVPFLSLVPGLRPQDVKRPRWNAFLGAALAFVGLMLLTVPAGGQGFWLQAGDLRTVNLGDVLTLIGSVAWALHCIALSRYSTRIPFHMLAMLQVGFCALAMAISLPFLERPQIAWTPRLWMALGITAVLATAAAFSIQSWVQSVLPPTHTALILTMEPVFAWLTSFFVTGERFDLRSGLGALLALAGIAVTELIPPPRVVTAHEV